MFSARFDDDAIHNAISELESSLEEEMHGATDDAAAIIANAARANHAYTNRTFLLEHMTLPGRTEGSFMAGTLRGYATGDTFYGGFVEELHDGRFAYLRPANNRTQSQQSRALERRLIRAVRRSRGWT